MYVWAQLNACDICHSSALSKSQRKEYMCSCANKPAEGGVYNPSLLDEVLCFFFSTSPYCALKSHHKWPMFAFSTFSKEPAKEHMFPAI